jgi:hypothetical protein
MVLGMVLGSMVLGMVLDSMVLEHMGLGMAHSMGCDHSSSLTKQILLPTLRRKIPVS